MLQTLSDWFWWDRLWFPGNLTWSDFKDHDEQVYARVSHLYVTLPCGVGFILIRYVFERLVALPFAKSLSIKNRARLQATPNAVLEKFFSTQSKIPSQAKINGLAKKCSWSVRQVERWFRRRRNQDRPSLVKKFQEACWRFVFYILAFIGGLAALYDKPWFYNTQLMWDAYPKQYLLPSQYWYYIIELSFYWSLLFSVAFDVRRKDFKEQIIHHLSAIVLLSFSWCANYIRVGTIVMIVHDASDVFLESAKMMLYAGFSHLANIQFTFFTLVFLVSRLIYFPFWIIHCTWVYPVNIYPPFFGYYFFNVMLVILQILNLYWAYLILKMVAKLMFSDIKHDERSDEDEEDLSDNSEDDNMNSLGSGKHLNNFHTH
ncbi:ceramide synthase 3 [Protopterus annectens]|uniref:ceramide synthase 3 n=1 Tax=Protopterus annectens TaxID=7888 RepID=UPI001CFA77B9|nr:ceramide synthase 3 [Protopterus annectens]